MDAGRGTNMDIATIIEVVQWVVIVVLVCLVVIEYFFISSLMEQIDLLTDRFLRLLNDQEQRDTANHSLERVRSWRGDITPQVETLSNEGEVFPHLFAAQDMAIQRSDAPPFIPCVAAAYS